MARTRAQRRAAPRRSTPTTARKSRYSFPELESLWIAAGGDPDKAQEAAAIAMAESRGRTGRAVQSRNPAGGVNRGPWQIWSGHPDSTDDPLGNARAAVRISKNGKDWSAWETYAKGLHKPFLIGKAPDKSLLEKLATGPLGDVVNTAIKPLDPLVAVGKLATGLTELILTPEGWRQIAKVTIGGVIVLWALNQLSKSIFDVTPTRAVARGVSKATPAGRVAGGAAKKVAGKVKGGGS